MNRIGPRRRHAYLPTPDEIKAACELIRAEWSPYEEQVRRGARGLEDFERLFRVSLPGNPAAQGRASHQYEGR